MMEDILYMVASIPIIDLSFIRNYSWKPGRGCPCVCPFHTKFAKLKNMFIPEDKASFMGQIECIGELVYRDRKAFVHHCGNERDFPY